MRNLMILVGLCVPMIAGAAKYRVGPSQKYRQIADVVAKLGPGDEVEVDGDAIYKAFEIKTKGTKAAPIVIKGVRKNGKRPVIEGGTYDGKYTLMIKGGWTTFDGFEIRGGTEVCVFNKAHGIVIRDALIHKCPRHGVLGADDEAGSITLSYVEVCDSGGEIKGESLKHPIYIATDEKMYPEAIFRMEHSWVHRNNGGNNVKSRARRTELYYNWIEGAQYYEIELIGPATKTGLGPPREDSDVVGNVLVNTSDNYVARVGSDETGASEGRVRFVNNTFIMSKESPGVVRLHYELESVEFYNNAFIHTAKWNRFLRDSETRWVSGRRVRGSHNYISHDPKGIDNFPPEFTDTIYGADACVEDLALLDLRPREGSPLVDAGTTETTSKWSPVDVVALPTWVPTLHAPRAGGTASKRTRKGDVDLGAYELGSETGPLGKHGAYLKDAKPRPAKCAARTKTLRRSGGKAEAGGTNGGDDDDDDDEPADRNPLRTPGRARTFGLIGGGVVIVIASVLIAVGIKRGRGGAV